VVDMEVTSTGAIAWCVRGVARAPAAEALAVQAPSLPASPAIQGEVASEVAKPVAKSQGVSIPGFGWKLGFSADPDRKSILLSGGASLLFGPFGWMYAGAWKEVLPAIAIYAAVVALFPKFLIATLLGVVHPACGVVGMVYAYRHNRTKARTPLLLVDPAPSVLAAGSSLEKTDRRDGDGSST